MDLACRGKDEIASGSDSGRRRWTRNAKADPTIGREAITDVVIERCVLKRPLVLQNSQNWEMKSVQATREDRL